jgi:prevent-host-death family protein
MITETSEVAFRQNLANMLSQVHSRGDSIVVNKDGKPIAALVGARLFARIRRLRRRFDELSNRLAHGFEGVPEEDGLEAVQVRPEIMECHMVAGGFDYLLKTRMTDMNAYRAFAGTVLWQLPGVRETRTYAVMEEVKCSTRLALGV